MSYNYVACPFGATTSPATHKSYLELPAHLLVARLTSHHATTGPVLINPGLTHLPKGQGYTLYKGETNSTQ
jgi:hypothetical protein